MTTVYGVCDSCGVSWRWHGETCALSQCMGCGSPSDQHFVVINEKPYCDMRCRKAEEDAAKERTRERVAEATR